MNGRSTIRSPSLTPTDIYIRDIIAPPDLGPASGGSAIMNPAMDAPNAAR